LKKILAIALLCSSWAISSYALSFLDKTWGMKKMNIRHTNALANKRIELKKYTNFTNNWKGRCVTNNHDTHDISFSIKNDEDTISFDGIEYDFNTLSTHASSGNIGSDITHVMLRWNEEGDQLIVNYMMIDNSNSTELFYSSVGRDTIELIDNQLVIKKNYQQFRNGVAKNASAETCILLPVK